MKDLVNASARWRFGSTQTTRSGIVWSLCLVVGLGVLWESSDVVAQALFTKPSRIFVVFMTDYERLLTAVWQSGEYVLFGVTLGALLGSVLGLVAASYNRMWRTCFIVIAFLIGFPKTGVFLIFVHYFGVLSDSSLYAMTFYNVLIFMFFMVFRTTRGILTQVSNPRLEVTVQLFATRFETVWYSMVPFVLPVAVTSAAYVSLGLWPFLIFAEPTGSPGVHGIGNYVFNAYQTGWWDHLYAGALTITAAALLTVALVNLLGRMLTYRL